MRAVTPRRLALLPVAVLALAACAHDSRSALARTADRGEATWVFPRPFQETRDAAIAVLRSLTTEVTEYTAHLEGLLPRTRTAPEARIRVWLLEQDPDDTVVRIEIVRGVFVPYLPPGDVREDVFLERVAERLGVPYPARDRSGPVAVEPSPKLPEPEADPGAPLLPRMRTGYGYPVGPLGAPALRAIAEVGFDKAFGSAAFRHPVRGATAYAHLAEGLEVAGGVSVPNDSGGRFDSRITVGGELESETARTRDLRWSSVRVEATEMINVGPVRAGLGVVQHLGARAVGRGDWPDVRFRASPGVVAQLGMVVPTGKPFRGVSSGLVVHAHASWVRLAAEGRRFDATSGGVALEWLF
jgi:hypothetical protein